MDSKKEKVLHVALKEFAVHGYSKASTNSIVKEAGISKGTLFNYFGSKEELFIHLFKICSDRITEAILSQANLEERDPLNRLMDWTVIKMNIFKSEPYTFTFLLKALTITDEKLAERIEEMRNEIMKKGYDMIFDDMDYSGFKEDVDVKRAMKVIMWSFEKLGEEYMEILKTAEDTHPVMDEVYDEAKEYVVMFREMFYKA